jgi:hypothetical protein
MLKSTESWDITWEKSSAFIFRAEEKTDRGKHYEDTRRSEFERTNGSVETGERF